MNILVYTRPKISSLRKKTDYSWPKAFIAVVMAGGEVPDIEETIKSTPLASDETLARPLRYSMRTSMRSSVKNQTGAIQERRQSGTKIMNSLDKELEETKEEIQPLGHLIVSPMAIQQSIPRRVSWIVDLESNDDDDDNGRNRDEVGPDANSSTLRTKEKNIQDKSST